VLAQKIDVPPGGGAFELPRLAIGVFLVPQETHRIAVSSDRKRHVPMRQYEGWVLPSGSTGTCEFDDTHSYLFVDFTDELLDDVGFDHTRCFDPVIGRLDPLLMRLISHTVLHLDGEQSLYRETMNLALAAHLRRVLGRAEAPQASIDDLRLRRAAAYIHDNLAENLSLDTLAAEATMSRYHFVRAFKAAFGKTPHQYVIHRRIERARLLLKTTGTPISELAFRLGYDDVSRFSMHFRRLTGSTPAAFRRQ